MTALRAFLFCLTILFVACVANVGYRDGDRTLLIVNKGLDPVAVYDGTGVNLAHVMPGQAYCAKLYYDDTETFFKLVTMSDTEYTPVVRPMDADGWGIEVSTMPLRYAAISLQPKPNCGGQNARQRPQQAPP